MKIKKRQAPGSGAGAGATPSAGCAALFLFLIPSMRLSGDVEAGKQDVPDDPRFVRAAEMGCLKCHRINWLQAIKERRPGTRFLAP
jgi:hypothetical protein